MTKHEAIEVLEEVKIFDDSMFAYSQAYNDALDMAIEALKAQDEKCRACGEKTNNVIQALQAELKSQEPRLMTLEEVKTMKRYTICAVEQRSKVLHTTFNAEYSGHLTIGGRDCIDFGLYADVSPFRRSESGYGKTWRCWTSCPSDEVRRATPWTQTNGLS